MLTHCIPCRSLVRCATCTSTEPSTWILLKHARCGFHADHEDCRWSPQASSSSNGPACPGTGAESNLRASLLHPGDGKPRQLLPPGCTCTFGGCAPGCTRPSIPAAGPLPLQPLPAAPRAPAAREWRPVGSPRRDCSGGPRRKHVAVTDERLTELRGQGVSIGLPPGRIRPTYKWGRPQCFISLKTIGG